MKIKLSQRKLHEAKRLVCLHEALENFDEIENKRTLLQKPDIGYDRIVLDLNIMSRDSKNGGVYHATIELDIETAKIVFPLIRDAVEREYEKLGGEYE